MPPTCRQSTRFRPSLARIALCATVLLWGTPAWPAGPPYAGQPVDAVLRALGTQGLHLVYSSETVPESLRVQREPTGTKPKAILKEVLAEHGLRARRAGLRTYVIVRAKHAAAATPPDAAPLEGAALEDIVIAASRYSLAADTPDAHTFLTHDEIEGLPRMGEDSLKAVHRLPAAASNGLAGLAYMRGGEANETLVVFDGLPLYEPFHLRLLLNPASVLDPRVLSGLDVHAGGFTAQYGDRMSAVIEAQSLRPAADAYYELGLSLFHLNGLASQRFASGRGQWLVAARRSNLDEIADITDSEVGEASYDDGFGRIDFDFSEHTRGSLHVLAANDRAEVRNSAATEIADAQTRNAYVWATLQHAFSPAVDARAILSYTDVTSDRDGTVNEPARRTGHVVDERHYDVIGVRLDGTFRTERWSHRAGLEYRSLSADYDYASAVRFDAGYPGPDSAGESTTHTASPEPSGVHVAAYVSSRVMLTDQLAMELGLRWDQQTYSRKAPDQWGPRVNLAWQPADTTWVRASWGRYQQFQDINELQVEDGVDEFQPAQRADHYILGVEHEFDAGFALRVEAYRKDYSSLKPRYESLFDPRSLVPELRWDRVRIAPDSARAEGVEGMLTRRNGDTWNGWLSYAWSKVADREDGTETRRSWDQTHSVGAGLTWTSGPWNSTIAATYRTGWPTTPVSVVDEGSPAAMIVVGPRNSRRYAEFGSVDLRVSRDFVLSRGELKAFVELTNAFNRRNDCCIDYSYAYPDGTLTLERDYRHWLPIVPSFGVLWKY